MTRPSASTAAPDGPYRTSLSVMVCSLVEIVTIRPSPAASIRNHFPRRPEAPSRLGSPARHEARRSDLPGGHRIVMNRSRRSACRCPRSGPGARASQPRRSLPRRLPRPQFLVADVERDPDRVTFELAATRSARFRSRLVSDGRSGLHERLRHRAPSPSVPPVTDALVPLRSVITWSSPMPFPSCRRMPMR